MRFELVNEKTVFEMFQLFNLLKIKRLCLKLGASKFLLHRSPSDFFLPEATIVAKLFAGTGPSNRQNLVDHRCNNHLFIASFSLLVEKIYVIAYSKLVSIGGLLIMRRGDKT